MGENKMSSRVLIIGATGGVGRHIADASLRSGRQTFLLLRPPPAALRDDDDADQRALLLRSFESRGATFLHVKGMSGLSLAVGPRESHSQKKDGDGSPQGLMGSVRTIELQLVAFIVVFSASGLVPVADLLFPVLVTPYLYILSKLIFPTITKEGVRLEVFRGSRMFQLYVAVGTVLGLFLPLAYVLGGFARGDQHAVRAATPHLFLLSVQVLSENLVSNLAVWSPPVRAFLVAIYNTRRIFSLADWVYDAFYKIPPPHFPRFKDIAWMWFGRGLASANLIYFIINMFCFIIPRFIPRAFERYLHAKVAQHEALKKTSVDDKTSTATLAEKKGK